MFHFSFLKSFDLKDRWVQISLRAPNPYFFPIKKAAKNIAVVAQHENTSENQGKENKDDSEQATEPSSFLFSPIKSRKKLEGGW